MSESNSRTQPRNLKVAYEDTFGNFHGKFQPAPRRWRHDSRGPSLARMQLNLHPVYIMQIHCLPLLLRLRDTFAIQSRTKGGGGGRGEGFALPTASFHRMSKHHHDVVITGGCIDVHGIDSTIRFCFQGDDILASTREPPRNRFEIIDANCGRYGIKRTVGND